MSSVNIALVPMAVQHSYIFYTAANLNSQCVERIVSGAGQDFCGNRLGGMCRKCYPAMRSNPVDRAVFGDPVSDRETVLR